MHTLSQQDFNQLLQLANLKLSLKNDLKYIHSIAQLPSDWSDYELIAIHTKSEDEGVLLVQPRDELYVIPYELSRRITDSATGRDRAIICDFCFTWQPGSNAASITFRNPQTKRAVRFLCCGDLACSEHVRTKTKAAKISRAQLRENLTDEGRIQRLKDRLQGYADQLELHPTKSV